MKGRSPYDQPALQRRAKACIGLRATTVALAAYDMRLLETTLQAVLDGRYVGTRTRGRVIAWCDACDALFQHAIPRP